MSIHSSDLVARLRELLAAHAPDVLTSAYLFGSVAEERTHRESDMDVAVLFRHALALSARDRFEEGLRLQTLMRPVTGQTPLDLVVLNDAPPALAARIVTTGQLLFCRDAEADHTFRRDAQLRAADLLPFLERTRAIKRETLAR